MGEVPGELGARVAITARKKDELDEASKHLGALGIDALPRVCDMGQTACVAPMVEQMIAKFGPIDILVNNAGTSWSSRRSSTRSKAGTR